MLGIAILIGICIEFFRLANVNNRNGWFYAILVPIIWFSMQFVAGILFSFIAPDLLSNSTNVLVIGLGASLIGITSYHFILKIYFKRNPKENSISENEDLLDN